MAPGPCFPPEFPIEKSVGQFEEEHNHKKDTFNFMKISEEATCMYCICVCSAASFWLV